MTMRLVAVSEGPLPRFVASRPRKDDDQEYHEGRSFTLVEFGTPVTIMRLQDGRAYILLTEGEISQLMDHHDWEDEVKLQRQAAEAIAA